MYECCAVRFYLGLLEKRMESTGGRFYSANSALWEYCKKHLLQSISELMIPLVALTKLTFLFQIFLCRSLIHFGIYLLMRSGITVQKIEHLSVFPKEKQTNQKKQQQQQICMQNVSWCMSIKPLLCCGMNPNHKFFVFDAKIRVRESAHQWQSAQDLPVRLQWLFVDNVWFCDTEF